MYTKEKKKNKKTKSSLSQRHAVNDHLRLRHLKKYIFKARRPLRSLLIVRERVELQFATLATHGRLVDTLLAAGKHNWQATGSGGYVPGVPVFLVTLGCSATPPPVFAGQLAWKLGQCPDEKKASANRSSCTWNTGQIIRRNTVQSVRSPHIRNKVLHHRGGLKTWPGWTRASIQYRWVYRYGSGVAPRCIHRFPHGVAVVRVINLDPHLPACKAQWYYYCWPRLCKRKSSLFSLF